MSILDFFSKPDSNVEFNSIEDVKHYLYDDLSKTDERLTSEEFRVAWKNSPLDKEVILLIVEKALEGDIPSMNFAIPSLDRYRDHILPASNIAPSLDINSEKVQIWYNVTKLKIDLLKYVAKRVSDHEWTLLIAEEYWRMGVATETMVSKLSFDNPTTHKWAVSRVTYFRCSGLYAQDVLKNFNNVPDSDRVYAEKIVEKSAEKLHFATIFANLTRAFDE